MLSSSSTALLRKPKAQSGISPSHLPKRTARRLPLTSGISALVLALCFPALHSGAANTLTWDSDGNFANGITDGTANWDLSLTNWDSGTGDAQWVNANNDIAVFGDGGTGGASAFTVTLTTGITAGGLTFNSSSTASSYTIAGNTLTLGGTTPTITTNTNATITSALAASSGFTKAGTAGLTLSRSGGNGASLGGTGLTINAGTVTLNGSGTGFDAGYFTGTSAIMVNTGATLSVLGNWNISSTNAITVNGGTLSMAGGNATGNDATNYINNLTLQNGATVNGAYALRTGNTSNSTFTSSGDTTNTFSDSIYLVNGSGGPHTLTFNVADGAATTDLAMSGVIRDLGQNGTTPSLPGMVVIKSGSGTMSLSAQSTFTGGVTVNGGTLNLISATLSGTATGAVGTGALTINSGALVTTNGAFRIDDVTTTSNARVININGGTLTLGGAEYVHTFNFTGGTLNAPTGDFFRVPTNGTTINTLAAATSATINNKVDMTFASITLNIADGAAANDLVVTGPISENQGAGSGAKTLTKNGAGTVQLTGANTYTGTTTINAGTLALAGTGSLASATIAVASGATYDVSGLTSGNYTLASGKTVSVASGGTMNGTTTISSGGTIAIASGGVMNGALTINAGGILAAGRTSGTSLDLGSSLTSAGTITIAGAGTAGTLSVGGNMTLNGGTVNFDLSATPTSSSGISDLISVASLNLSNTTTLAINKLGTSLGSGVYDLINYSGSLTGSVANLSLSGTSSGTTRQTFTLSTTGASAGSLILTVSGNAGNLVWKGDGTANVWDLATTSNFLNNGSADKYFDGDNVTFTDAGSNSPAVAITGTLQPNSVTVTNSATPYTFSGTGSIAGLTGLTKSGNGIVTITNTNSFTGPVTITQGTVSIPTIAAGGTNSPLGSGTTINFGDSTNNGTLQYTGVTASTNRTLNLNAGGGTVEVTTAGTTLTESGIISGSGSLTKTGPGILALTAANTYSGATAVNNGTLQIGAGGTTGAISAGAVTIGSTGILAYFRSDNGLTVANSFSGSGGLAFNGTGISLQSSYTITGTNTGFSGTITANNARVQAGGPVFGTASLVANSGGEFFLTAGTYANNLSIAGAGWLETSGQLGAIRLSGGATLTGTITLTGPATISTYGSSGQINGPIQESGGSQNLTLGVAGSTNTLTLNGASTYTGTTTITNATVTLNGSLGATAVTVSDGATLSGHGSIGGSLTLGSSTGATLIANAGTNGALSVAGNLTLTGTDTITLTPGAALPIGSPYTVISYGGSLTGTASNLTLANATNYRQAVFSAGGGVVTLDIGAKALTWTGASGATWDANTTTNFIDNTTTPQNFFAGDAVTFDDSSLNNIVTLNGALSPSSVVVSNSANSYTLNSGTTGSIAGSTGLVKKGTGILTINLANTYTGGTTISSGEVRISTASALGTGTVTLGDASTATNNVNLYLDTNRVSFTNPVVVTGNGNVTLGSRATITGSGANNYFSNITLQGNVTFDSNAADRTDYTITSGTGDVTITGTGRTIFLNPSTFLGNIIVTNPSSSSTQSFQIGAATAGNTNIIPDTSSVTVQTGALMRMSSGAEAIDALNGGGTINVNSINSVLTIGASNGSGTFSGVLANSTNTLGLTKAGTGSETLSGANTYTGATTVNGGTLQVTGSLAGTPVTVNSAGIFIVAGTANGSSTTVNGGTLSVPAGGTLGDTLTVASGTVQIGGSLSGSTAVVNGGSVLGASGSTISSAVSVNGGVFGGNGMLTGSVTVNNGGTLSPGQNGIGVLALSNSLTLNSGGHLAIDLAGNNQADGILVSGASSTVTLGGDLQLTLGYTPSVGDVFFIIVNQGPSAVSGLFSNAIDQGNGTGLLSAGGYHFLVSYTADSTSSAFGVNQGHDIALEVTPIPEPSAASALIGGLSALAGLQRFRRRR